VLAGLFFFRGDVGVEGPSSSSIPPVRTTPSPTPVPTTLPSPVAIDPPIERPLHPATGECTVLIPRSVTKVNGAGRYAGLRPGDVICLEPGERGNIKFSNIRGDAANPIIIRNEGGVVRIGGAVNRMGGIGLLHVSSVRVTGTGVSSACGADIAPQDQQCGIVIHDAFNGIRVDAAGNPRKIEIDHVKVSRTSQENHSTAFSIHPARGQTISGYYVHHNYLVDIHREGMYIGSEPHGKEFSPQLGKLTDVEISDNLVIRTGYDGIKVKVGVARISIHDNVVLDPALDQFPKHETGIQIAMSSADVYNNIVRGGVEGIASGRPLPAAATRYFNNVVIAPSREGFVTSENGAQIFANTIVGTAAEGVFAKGNDSQVFDNVIADSGGEPIAGGPRLVMVNNLIGTAASVGFVAPQNGDYRLKPTSPGIDQGAGTGPYPEFDVRRVSRPRGTRPEIGAYEYRAP